MIFQGGGVRTPCPPLWIRTCDGFHLSKYHEVLGSELKSKGMVTLKSLITSWAFSQWNRPRRKKTCLLGFWQSEIQTSLLIYRDELEPWNFACDKVNNDTFHKANNKGDDQTAGKRRLVFAFVVRKPPKTGFLNSRPKLSLRPLYTGNC